MGYHVATLAAVVAINFLAERYGSSPIKRTTFWMTAALPMLLFLALIAWFAFRDGLSTFSEQYFFVLLMMAVAFSAATTVTAFLAREFARWVVRRE
jgi:hypothetical protein